MSRLRKKLRRGKPALLDRLARQALKDHARAETVEIIGEHGKVRLELIAPAAKREEAKALDHGNRKDGRTPWNWRTGRVKLSDQIGGALRHIDQFMDGEDLDAASLAHHLGHARARLGIVIDALERGTIIDDRVIANPRKPMTRKRRGK